MSSGTSSTSRRYPARGLSRKERQDSMTVEDGGATFSLIVYDQPMTLGKLAILQSIDGVTRVLPGNNTFTVIFKVDSFLEVTVSAVARAHRAIKKALGQDEYLPLRTS